MRVLLGIFAVFFLAAVTWASIPVAKQHGTVSIGPNRLNGNQDQSTCRAIRRVLNYLHVRRSPPLIGDVVAAPVAPVPGAAFSDWA